MTVALLPVVVVPTDVPVHDVPQFTACDEQLFDCVHDAFVPDPDP